MRWAVEFHDEFVPEFHGLHERVQDEIYAIAHMLEQFGPQLGRPRVDTLNGSHHANLKEMCSARPTENGASPSPSTPRAALSFWLRADKSGGSSRRFYRALVRRPDQRFDRHLARLARKGRS